MTTQPVANLNSKSRSLPDSHDCGVCAGGSGVSDNIGLRPKRPCWSRDSGSFVCRAPAPKKQLLGPRLRDGRYQLRGLTARAGQRNHGAAKFVKDDSAPMVDLIPPSSYRVIPPPQTHRLDPDRRTEWEYRNPILARRKTRDLRNFACGWPTRCTHLSRSTRAFLSVGRWGATLCPSFCFRPSAPLSIIVNIDSTLCVLCWQGKAEAGRPSQDTPPSSSKTGQLPFLLHHHLAFLPRGGWSVATWPVHFCAKSRRRLLPPGHGCCRSVETTVEDISPSISPDQDIDDRFIDLPPALLLHLSCILRYPHVTAAASLGLLLKLLEHAFP
jgi:hypothetical protein